MRPAPQEYSEFHATYIRLVPEEPVLDFLSRQGRELDGFLTSAPESQVRVSHPPYRWSLQQVVGHVIDTERIMGYRALAIARGDRTPLPGFDENAYVEVAEFDRAMWSDLLAQLRVVHASTLALFGGFNETAWRRQGNANGAVVSVRALAYVIAGHAEHHLRILRTRLAGVASARP